MLSRLVERVETTRVIPALDRALTAMHKKLPERGYPSEVTEDLDPRAAERLFDECPRHLALLCRARYDQTRHVCIRQLHFHLLCNTRNTVSDYVSMMFHDVYHPFAD